MAHFMISAVHKSSGKTLVSIGLCGAFSRQGLHIQPFKKGPDYIDPMWLSTAAHRDCHNLDFYTMNSNEILTTFARHDENADLSIIEGNKGLYDGLDLDGSNSNAALAKLLHTPVILVMDARGMTRGIAPIILGFQSFDQSVDIAGVIINQLGGRRHEKKLKNVIEHYTEMPVIGAILHNPKLEIAERHLGLVPNHETTQTEKLISTIINEIADQIDLKQLQSIAQTAKTQSIQYTPEVTHTGSKVRIGIIRDSAFNFYYPGDLSGLEQAGAILVPINSLSDTRLPPIDGLFIGGGFPETHMQPLENNASLRNDIYTAIDSGLPTYAECGGLMYLTKRIEWHGQHHQMVGIIPAHTIMHDTPQGRGYVRLRETGNGLWPLTAKSDPHNEIPAHEFHYSSLSNLDNSLKFAYKVTRGTGIDGKNDGLIYKNLLASYSHLRNVEANRWTTRFVEFVRLKREQGSG